MNPHLFAAVGLGLVALVYFLAERSVSFFSWSMFEELSAPRPRRQATERCLQERELVSVTFLCVGSVALTAAAACTVPVLDRAAEDVWVTAIEIAAMALFVCWLLPEILAWYIKNRIMLYVVPPLYALTGFPFRMIRTAFGVSLSASDRERNSAEGNAATDAATVDGEAREFMRMAVRLQHMLVREIMTPRTDMVSIRETTPLKSAAETSRKSGYSRLPVYRRNRDEIVGILHIKDLLAFADTDRWKTDTVAGLVRAPLFIPETKAISELMEEFQRSNTHMGIVLDEYGGTAGLVTLEDVVEELIGEIHDEHEPPEEEEPLYKWLDDRTAEVQAVMHVEEFNEVFDRNIPEEEDFDTIGGYVLFMMGKIPAPGESFDTPEERFTVVEADQRRIVRVRVDFVETPPAKEKV